MSEPRPMLRLLRYTTSLAGARSSSQPKRVSSGSSLFSGGGGGGFSMGLGPRWRSQNRFQQLKRQRKLRRRLFQTLQDFPGSHLVLKMSSRRGSSVRWFDQLKLKNLALHFFAEEQSSDWFIRFFLLKMPIYWGYRPCPFSNPTWMFEINCFSKGISMPSKPHWVEHNGFLLRRRFLIEKNGAILEAWNSGRYPRSQCHRMENQWKSCFKRNEYIYIYYKRIYIL